MTARQVSKSSIGQGLPKTSKVWDGISTTAFSAELLLVGGGGGGGNNSCYGGGGGGGGTQDVTIQLKLAQTYSISIGSGGAVETDGGSTSISGPGVSYTANGGGRGMNMTGGTSGNGYGGGGYALCSGCCAAGGGGGGATGGGSGAAGCSSNGWGGPGLNWKSLGTSYGAGGRGLNNCAGWTSGAQRGDAGSGAVAGNAGIAIIRYLGSPKGTGGTITSSGGYTYHTFLSNGDLVT
jgi:hypothetical protein